jgi:hypothetical protein
VVERRRIENQSDFTIQIKHLASRRGSSVHSQGRSPKNCSTHYEIGVQRTKRLIDRSAALVGELPALSRIEMRNKGPLKPPESNKKGVGTGWSPTPSALK